LEADESYFVPKCIRGKRGRGASGKTIVFSLLKLGNCVYTEIVPDTFKAQLQAIIRGKVAPNSVIHTDRGRGYDGTVDIGVAWHFRVNHGINEFVKASKHINAVKSLRSNRKHRLAQFHCVARHTFAMHSKEREFRCKIDMTTST
jgi:transposase